MMTKHPPEYFDRLLRIGFRDQIRAHRTSMAFMSTTERRPIFAEIRRLERILDRALPVGALRAMPSHELFLGVERVMLHLKKRNRNGHT